METLTTFQQFALSLMSGFLFVHFIFIICKAWTGCANPLEKLFWDYRDEKLEKDDKDNPGKEADRFALRGDGVLYTLRQKKRSVIAYLAMTIILTIAFIPISWWFLLLLLTAIFPQVVLLLLEFFAFILVLIFTTIPYYLSKYLYQGIKSFF